MNGEQDISSRLRLACAKLRVTPMPIGQLIPLLQAAADKIEHLRAELVTKQAQIDHLMLEHCPDEMTAEQIAEWGRHQVPSAPIEKADWDTDIVRYKDIGEQ